MSPIRSLVALSLLAALLASVSSAFAQVPASTQVPAPRTTGGGLFGATRSDVDDANHLNLTLAVSEGFDTDLPQEVRLGLPQNIRRSGGYSTLATANVAYAHTRRRAEIGGHAETAFRYYNRLDLVDGVGHSGGIGANIRLAGASRLRINQTGAFSPSFLYGLFPSTVEPGLGDTIPVAPEYRVIEADSYRYRSEVAFVAGEGRRTRASASGIYDLTNIRNHPRTQPRLESYSGEVKVERGLRRNLDMSAEYRFVKGSFRYAGTGISIEHRLAIGADYTKPYSGGRRLRIRGGIAPSVLTPPDTAATPASVDTAAVGEAESVYRIQGDVTLEYNFRRTWRIAGTARRTAEYLAVLGEPVLSNSGNVELRGLLTRRTDIAASAAFSGAASIISANSQLDTYRGNVRVRHALHRSVAIYGEYIYYYYDLRQYHRQFEGLPALFDQQSIRGGVMLWGSAF